MRIVMAGQNDAVISKAVINAIETPNDQDRYMPTLLDYYNTDGTFQTVAFRVDYPEGMELSRRLRTADVLRTLLSRTIRKFTLMRYEDFFVLVLNDTDEATADDAAGQLLRRCAGHAPPLSAHIGVGSQVNTVQNLHNSYRRARAAARMADYFKRDLIHFRDMGIYQLLFTAEDPDILEGFYRDNLGMLEDYDRDHNSCLLDTLYYDLLTGGSVKGVAEAMYTHRNTVNYRLGKIKELLGTGLDDADERTRYRMAFYARDILLKMWQTRDSRLATQSSP
jgi:DNA-binding PucR family transcriptional regulator